MDTKTLTAKLDTLFSEVINYVSAVDEQTFFHKEKAEVWSIAEEVHHLTLTIYPVNGVFRHPENNRVKYGVSTRPSRSYEQFAEEYKATVAQVEWRSFMPFIPKQNGEEDGYAGSHLQKDKTKLDQFYHITGEQINGLRDKLPMPADRKDIIALYTEQARMLAMQAAQLSDEDLDTTLIPLPYMGLITLREILYLNLIHNRYHLDKIRAKRTAYCVAMGQQG